MAQQFWRSEFSKAMVQHRDFIINLQKMMAEVVKDQEKQSTVNRVLFVVVGLQLIFTIILLIRSFS